MAVNSNEDIDPELTENANMMLFAEDLVNILLIRNSKKYRSEFNPISFCDHIYNEFELIAKAVFLLDDTMEGEHVDLFGELLKANFVNSESYEIFAKTLTTKYFSEGFDEKYFLIYCVNLSVMASYFYNKGIVDVPDSAKIHIYMCLQEYDRSDNGLDAIHRIAGTYEKMLLHSVNEPTSPDISLVSDEIKHLDQEEEEASEDSKSLQIEGKRISSGNEEINFKQLKVTECSFQCLKAFQKKYARYSSKRRSDVGLCSLKEPESFSETLPNVTLDENKSINRSESDNEEASDNSKVDQGLLLIISDFKKKMDLLWNEIKRAD